MSERTGICSRTHERHQYVAAFNRRQVSGKNYGSRGKDEKKGDIVLYRRTDGTLVLHRIMKIEEDGFRVCGDHQWKLDEKVQEEQILAVAQGFFINGNYIDEKTWWYRLYKRFWNGNLTVRRCCLAFLRLSGLENKS